MNHFIATDAEWITRPRQELIVNYANQGDVMEVGRIVMEQLAENMAERVELRNLSANLMAGIPAPMRFPTLIEEEMQHAYGVATR